MKPYLKSFIFGVMIYLILSQLKIMIDTRAFSSGIIHLNDTSLLFFNLLFAIILSVVPGYISGWLTKDKGTLIGLFVGIIGFSIQFTVTIYLKGEVDTLSFAAIFTKWLEKAIYAAIIGAISGAAGQLHKLSYTKRLYTRRSRNYS